MKKGLGIARNELVAALDIGSSKICCFIAQIEERGRPNVIGIGQQVSRGVKSGTLVDLELAENAIVNAVHAAEQMAGERIERVVLNLSGGHPASTSFGVEVSIAGHEVGDADLRRALAQSHDGSSSNGDAYENGRHLVHSIPVGYAIDGNRGIRDPRGMYGDCLGVKMHIITAAAGAVRNIANVVQRCHLEIDGFVVSPYASGLSALVEDELELGVTLVDLGGGTTTLAVFFEGKVVYTDAIPVGGQHVTNDIARGLSTPVAAAERMKTLYGHAMAAAADDREMIDVPLVGEDETSQPIQVPRSLLVGIVQPRLEETFELVRQQLELSGFDKIAGRRVVLTGGACQLPGLRDLAALVLDKQVRIGRPLRIAGLAEATSGPAYATCAGLLAYAAAAELTLPRETKAEAEMSGGFIGKFGNWFREHF